MTVSSTQSYVEYNADGVTTTFTIPFYFLLNSDISVMIANSAGSISEPVNGTDYIVTGAGDSGGGSLTFGTVSASGNTILIYRNPPVTQETKYYENGKFPAASHEAALDKLTMLIQEYGWRFDSLTLKKPSIFASYYDALNNRIGNLADPVNDQDAVNKRFVTSQVADFKGYVDSEVAAEATARKSADDALQASLDAETLARQNADANIQDQLTGNVPLEASAFSPISWHAQEVSSSVTIPNNVNAWSFGPTVAIANGQSVTVGDGSFWTIADGLQSGGSAENLDYGTL
ncbi:phage tail fiber domain-containing protein [Pantoea anthophila]|uniref:phage tail fiber domain-containing protein n=1 Tax=Pantoea anthophila TaxID=470931 RepID=UPI002DB66167|nr:phage tail fiber protein [Pantoea anthophila]MEB5707360.1 phage tail fiber protein [Pantoea anthophila]MEB6518231.1 phage tail fiber protein [Pantoea anthophila]